MTSPPYIRTVDDFRSRFGTSFPFLPLNDSSCHGEPPSHQILHVVPARRAEYHDAVDDRFGADEAAGTLVDVGVVGYSLQIAAVVVVVAAAAGQIVDAWKDWKYPAGVLK